MFYINSFTCSSIHLLIPSSLPLSLSPSPPPPLSLSLSIVYTCLNCSISTLLPAIASTKLGGPNCLNSCIQLCISVKLFYKRKRENDITYIIIDYFINYSLPIYIYMSIKMFCYSFTHPSILSVTY